MERFDELDIVRVRQLLQPERHFDGTDGCKRPPRVGDRGTVVFVQAEPGGSPCYTVEMVDAEGYTVWPADFKADELEAVSAPGRPTG
jgi:hypothetical protein